VLSTKLSAAATGEPDFALYKTPGPGPLSLDEVIEGEVRVEPCSQMIPGASDVFRFRISDVSLATGVVGGEELIATYGKLGAAALPVDRVDLEAFLADRYGPLY